MHLPCHTVVMFCDFARMLAAILSTAARAEERLQCFSMIAFFFPKKSLSHTFILTHAQSLFMHKNRVTHTHTHTDMLTCIHTPIALKVIHIILQLKQNSTCFLRIYSTIKNNLEQDKTKTTSLWSFTRLDVISASKPSTMNLLACASVNIQTGFSVFIRTNLSMKLYKTIPALHCYR